MKTKYTRVYIINDKLVVADKIEKAIEVYNHEYPFKKIESLTLLSSKLQSDSYDKDFDALIEDTKGE
jgi:hypothetical protein